MTTETWTVRKLLSWTEDFLRRKGIESARLEAQILLAHVLGCTKIDLFVRHEEVPTDPQRTQFREMIKQRADGSPVAYLVGHREFYSLPFIVTPAVLIPRPETELLVMEALQLLNPMVGPRVLDLCTGSGCVAISIAKRHKTAQVIASDASAAALEVARKNAEKNAVSDRVELREGDLFSPVDGQFDVVVSNPPYISHAELANLEPGVRDFEPRAALDGGADGLDFYRRMASEARHFLKPGGALLVEMGATQEAEVRGLFADWPAAKLFKDPAGRPRVLMWRV